MDHTTPVGRFAPTPSGRMHLGNVFAALMSYLSVKSRDGVWILRMEDLDTQRTRPAYAQLLREDLAWLGLVWDRETTPQSRRGDVYDHYFGMLREQGLLYPCYCTRSQLHNVNAPHLSDGTYVYPGTCRSLTDAQRAQQTRLPSWRVMVPQERITLNDLVQGEFTQDLARECGDFVIRRGDGVYTYQLAVTVDDGESGVTEVIRGWDLLGSAPRQRYLQTMLGFPRPEYGHIPILTAPDGRRLSKRDLDLDLGALRSRLRPEQLLGILAHASGLTDQPGPISLEELTAQFSWDRVAGRESIPVTDLADLL